MSWWTKFCFCLAMQDIWEDFEDIDRAKKVRYLCRKCG